MGDYQSVGPTGHQYDWQLSSEWLRSDKCNPLYNWHHQNLHHPKLQWNDQIQKPYYLLIISYSYCCFRTTSGPSDAVLLKDYCHGTVWLVQQLKAPVNAKLMPTASTVSAEVYKSHLAFGYRAQWQSSQSIRLSIKRLMYDSPRHSDRTILLCRHRAENYEHVSDEYFIQAVVIRLTKIKLLKL